MRDELHNEVMNREGAKGAKRDFFVGLL